MASRDRWLRASVCRATEETCQTSKACVSMRRFISVFAPVLMAAGLSQVLPISHVSGPVRAWPSGQSQ
jgi:hypothetical protein